MRRFLGRSKHQTKLNSKEDENLIGREIVEISRDPLSPLAADGSNTEISSITQDYIGHNGHNVVRGDVHHQHPLLEPFTIAQTFDPQLRFLLGSLSIPNENTNQVSSAYVIPAQMRTPVVTDHVGNVVPDVSNCHENYSFTGYQTSMSVSTKFGVKGGELIRCVASREWGEVLSLSHSHSSIISKQSQEWSRAPLSLSNLSNPSNPKHELYSASLSSDSQPVLPIHLACVLNPPRGVIDVLSRAYPIGIATAETKTGKLPLHLAILSGANQEVIDFLCDVYPAGLRTRDNEGRFPIHYAVIWRDANICEMLLKHYPAGAKAVDDAEKTALDLVGMSGNVHRNEIIKVLQAAANLQSKHQAKEKVIASKRRQSIESDESKETKEDDKDSIETPSKNSKDSGKTTSRQYSSDDEILNMAQEGIKTDMKTDSRHSFSSSIDYRISQLVRHKAEMASKQDELLDNESTIKAARRKSEKVRVTKLHLEKQIDARKGKISQHLNTINSVQKQIEDLKELLAKESKKVEIEKGKLEKDGIHVKSLEVKEKQIQEEIKLLDGSNEELKNSLCDIKTVHIPTLERQLYQMKSRQ